MAIPVGLACALYRFSAEEMAAPGGDNYRDGQASDRLISFLDLAPTMLSLAGAQLPEHLMGSAILGTKATSPQVSLRFEIAWMNAYDFSRASEIGGSCTSAIGCHIVYKDSI